ncbi:unnamed protein product [Rotaria sp. Silwood2]|nr:unnamed protein product [Rotaria sp. Silwood2]CAF2917515.1 unnamed protein product [Rotaria sp. Silwood2]CAF4381913.1 unnamed protein product [Rotaria sp. Silwood2]CAF4441056.1 unnamed protein product [Rotaria sp. Silwood2]
MNHSTVNILTLCDEMLLVIFNKLNNIDVLYSLIGVNRKLDRLARDITFTQSLDLVTISSNKNNDSRNKSILDRFCFDILPRIQHNIESLTLDPLLMDRVLRIENYSKLHKINLVIFQLEVASRILNDESSIIHIFKDQISHLTVTIKHDSRAVHRKKFFKNVFITVFIMFINLTYLHFDVKDMYLYSPISLIDLPSTTCYSSSIVYLNVSVRNFDDCLCLLDGRLSQLYTLIVKVYLIQNTSMIINNTKTLSNLKCFSLISFRRTIAIEYDNQILPLLRQMSQLEKLTLYLIVRNRISFIDGTHLVNDILSKMLYLHTFIFNIITGNVIMDAKFLPTPDDVVRPLIEKGYNVNCYTDYSDFSDGKCHIYSLPFTMDRMHIHSNKFAGGLFMTVRYLYLQDYVRSFEHDFFAGISRAFPLLDRLMIFNLTEQKKLTHQDEQETFSIIEFSHLTLLDLTMCYIDYVKQFLFDFNTRLPCLKTLYIKYEDLMIVTECFTNNAARANCSKVELIIFVSKPMIYPENFHLYFPFVVNKISS